MVREYIGARYVLKFHENSLNPASPAWEGGITYEPLTLVTYSNDSFVSKKFVPNNIGDPASNPDYWAITGAYNGQIANLQNQIDDINNDLLVHSNSLAGRKFILVGDSYGRGYDGDTGTYTYRGWTYINKDYLEAAGAEVYLLSNNPAAGGFTTGTTWLQSMVTLVQSQGWTSDDLKTITDIVVLGGTNDTAEGGASYATIKGAIHNFATWVHGTFPNARVALGIVSANLTALCNNAAQTWKAYSECVEEGIEFLTDGALLFNNATYIGADKLHLTSAGYQKLCPKLFDLIVTGHCTYSYFYDVDITLNAAFTPATIGETQAKLFVLYDQNTVTYALQGAVASGSGLTLKTTSTGDAAYIATLSSDIPACVPFTRQYMVLAQGDVFTVNASNENKLNSTCSMFATSCGVTHGANTTMGVQIGQSYFVRSTSDLLCTLKPKPINVCLERY